MSAHWMTAADTIDLTMPATATWCTGPARLDIRASAGDTGVGLAVYPVDSLALAGDYSIVEPGGPVSFRPSAAVAVRWVGKVQVFGWWGDSGAVTLAGKRVGRLSGQGAGRMVSSIGPDSTIHFTVQFRGLPVQVDSACDAPAPPAAPRPDSGAPPPALPAPGID